jgi:serine/threonine protein kinase/antitoxin component YwqK of YwqJK toxin-antitoxin module
MKSDNLRALPSGIKISDYQIQGVLGFGGFGITYLALDIKLDLKVAIKEYFPREFAVRAHSSQVKPAGSNEDKDTFKWGLNRFLQEARVLARFRHPNIVAVTRFFEENGTAYLVMDYCDGRPLDHIFENEGTLSYVRLRSIIPPLLDALERVHRASLLHRDIKPANIFLREDDSPVLLDFGAARQEIVEHSRSVTSLVTANYSSIEQYSTHGKQGPWSDIYSLGATLYRAVTGVKLQDAPDRTLEDQVQPIDSLASEDFPRVFLEAIDAAIRVRPQDRPQSISEWRALFGSSLDREQELTSSRKHKVVTGATEAAVAQSDDKKLGDKKFVLGIAFLAFIGLATILYLNSNAPSEEKEAKPVPAPQPTIVKSSRLDDANKETQIAKSEAPKAGDGSTPTAKSLPKCVGDDPLKFHGCIGSRVNSNGVKYTGVFQNGKESGKGEAVWPSGLRYVGEFRDGSINGRGKFYFENGDTQEATFIKGAANGKGSYRWKSGSVFEGSYVNDKREGPGVYRWSNGEVFEGNYVNNEREGPGTHRWPSGQSQEALYRNGRETNPITLRLVNGDTYIGDINFETNKYEGKGTYRFKDGRRYVGEFRDGKRHGSGIDYDSTGVITRSGQWRNDEFTAQGDRTPPPSASASAPTQSGMASYATPTLSIQPRTSDSEKLRLCETEAAETKRSFPRRLDLVTTATNVFCIQTVRGVMLVYRLEYSGAITASNQRDLHAKLFESNRKNWCDSANLRAYLRQIEVEFRYFEETSKVLNLVVTLAERDCK